MISVVTKTTNADTVKDTPQTYLGLPFGARSNTAIKYADIRMSIDVY